MGQPPIVQDLPPTKMRGLQSSSKVYLNHDRENQKNPENHMVWFLKNYLQIMVEIYLVNNKVHLNTYCYMSSVGNDRGQTFSLSLHKV